MVFTEFLVDSSLQDVCRIVSVHPESIVGEGTHNCENFLFNPLQEHSFVVQFMLVVQHTELFRVQFQLEGERELHVLTVRILDLEQWLPLGSWVVSEVDVDVGGWEDEE